MARASGRDAASGQIALVHNGIIENHDELRAELRAKGLRLRQPDRHRSDRPLGAPPVRRRSARRRAASVCRACAAHMHSRVLPRRTAPCGRRPRGLAAGARRGPRGELPGLRCDGTGRCDRPDRVPRGRRRRRPADGPHLDQRTAARRWLPQRGAPGAHGTGAQRRAELGPYRHYMQKEIFEQPRAIADTLDGVAGVSPNCSAMAPGACSRTWTRC